MVAFAQRKLNLPVGPAIAALGAGVAGISFGLLPDPALYPIAGFQVDVTERVVVAIGAGGLAGSGLLALARLLLGKPRRADGTIRLRREDAHPDAPPREPVLAHRDLGTPFLEVHAGTAGPAESDRHDVPANALPDLPPLEPLPDSLNPFTDVELPLPRDLDTPMVAYADGKAAARHGDMRIESFVLTPPRPEPRWPASGEEPIAGPQTEATIHALLARLEQGVSRRGRPPFRPAPARSRSPNLEATLSSLRQIAAQG